MELVFCCSASSQITWEGREVRNEITVFACGLNYSQQ